jgi:hypothetical protein
MLRTSSGALTNRVGCTRCTILKGNGSWSGYGIGSRRWHISDVQGRTLVRDRKFSSHVQVRHHPCHSVGAADGKTHHTGRRQPTELSLRRGAGNRSGRNGTTTTARGLFRRLLTSRMRTTGSLGTIGWGASGESSDRGMQCRVEARLAGPHCQPRQVPNLRWDGTGEDVSCTGSIPTDGLVPDACSSRLAVWLCYFYL